MTDWLENLSPDVAVLATVGLAAVLVIAALGRRLSVTVGNVHAELTPNGGSSLRDAVNRIETKADDALKRISALEAAPTAAPLTAIVVQPSSPPETAAG
jgi:hexokinase